MIRTDAELHSDSSFREWASLFSGKYFVMLAVYADETGTGGIPKSGKEPSPGICGFLATPEMWETFRVSWKAMLAKHDAPYFHFRELNKSERAKTTNHFHNWDDDEVDDFIYDMAIVASGGPIPFGGNAAVKMVHGSKPNKENLNETYGRTFRAFFEDFEIQMATHFPKEKEKVTFFFSEIENENWISILNNAKKSAQEKNKRIGELVFIDPKSDRGIPCQAADLFAAINRQNNETIYEAQRHLPHRVLDIILARQGFPIWHPFRAMKEMSEQQWKNLIAELRARRKHFNLQHELAGTKPKPQYYPIFEHPYFIYLRQLCLEHEKKHPKLWL